jgi:hypothetical protein
MGRGGDLGLSGGCRVVDVLEVEGVWESVEIGRVLSMVRKKGRWMNGCARLASGFLGAVLSCIDTAYS